MFNDTLIKHNQLIKKNPNKDMFLLKMPLILQKMLVLYFMIYLGESVKTNIFFYTAYRYSLSYLKL